MAAEWHQKSNACVVGVGKTIAWDVTQSKPGMCMKPSSLNNRHCCTAIVAMHVHDDVGLNRGHRESLDGAGHKVDAASNLHMAANLQSDLEARIGSI